MIFRIALESDLQEMKNLFLETIQNVCKNDYNLQQIEAWTSTADNSERWLEMLKTQLVLLVIIEDKIVGYGTLKNNNYIDFLYVHKDFQRQGIADKIVSKLEQEARKFNSNSLTSDVSITAKPFFEKNGFIVLQKQINIRNNVELINFKMQKFF